MPAQLALAHYNWCKDPLAPSIDGTIVCIEHHVDGIAVYICSDDDLCYDMPYDVKDLLCLVPLAYDNWGALLDFV